MKQKRMMLMLGGVLVVLIGCYVGLKAWNDHQQEQAEADEEAAKIRLVDAEGLTAVSYTDGESTLGFTLEEDTWRYTEDQEIPMNQDVVGGFADTVASLNATRELENPDDISDYELDSPSYTINYTTEDGEDGTIYIYYASCDTRMHVATTTIDKMEDYLFNTPEDPKRSPDCVKQRCELIAKNLEILKAEGEK